MRRPRSREPGPDPPWMDPDEEGEREVGLHLEYLVDELMAEGRTEEEARLEAMRRFGNVETARRATRAMARRRNGGGGTTLLARDLFTGTASVLGVASLLGTLLSPRKDEQG